MYLIKKIYYDKVTGERIWDNSYDYLAVVDFEHDYNYVIELNGRVKDSIGLLVLENGQYAQDFQEGRLIGVNVETKVPIFEYPNPEVPEEPIVVQKPLTSQVQELKQYTQQLNDDLLSLSDYVVTL